MEKKIKLIAELSKDSLALIWKEKSQVKKIARMKVDHGLSRKTLPFLDRFLKRSGLSIKDIAKIELRSEMSDSFTSYRIVKVILDTAVWAGNCG